MSEGATWGPGGVQGESPGEFGQGRQPQLTYGPWQRETMGEDSTQHLPFTTADTVKTPTNQGFFPQASPGLTPTLKILLRLSIPATHQKHSKA